MMAFNYRGKKIIYFPQGNKYIFGQDFSFYKGIPSDIGFTVENDNDFAGRFLKDDELIALRAANYGGDPYGNGCIYVNAKDLKEVLDHPINNPEKSISVEDIVTKALANRNEVFDAYILRFLESNNCSINDIEIVEKRSENEIAWFVRKKEED